MLNMPNLSAVAGAQQRIAPFIIETPVRPAMFGKSPGREILYKCEHVQISGAFKVRGALNHTLSLSSKVRRVIAASTGNHGVAVAYAAKCTQREASIFMPSTTSPQRRERIEQLGAQVHLVGNDCVDAELAARHEMNLGHGVYISPYNDPIVVEGQATLGLELYQQVPDLTHVIIAVGGGGLIAGMGSVLKQLNPAVQVIGASPANSNVMARSVESGMVETWSGLDTQSTSTAGGLEEPSVTLPICRRVVDQWIDVSERDITKSMARLLKDELIYIEGAAAVADAATQIIAPKTAAGAKIVVLLCGANR
jgi:threonine dehydratase